MKEGNWKSKYEIKIIAELIFELSMGDHYFLNKTVVIIKLDADHRYTMVQVIVWCKFEKSLFSADALAIGGQTHLCSSMLMPI